jgi:hypothetical protein
VGAYEVRWDKGGIETADSYTFICGNGNDDRHLRTGFFVYKEMRSPGKKVGFATDRMAYIYITLRGR